MRTANPHIQKLPENTAGRDFVIGDIHGCLPAVETLLKKVEFNPEKDRLIATGDLSNKGPDSLGTILLLEQPWFHSVRGNHDSNTLAALRLHFDLPTSKPDAFYRLACEGGLWLCELVAKSLSSDPLAPRVSHALATALHCLEALPRILVVGDGPARYHVVHAALLKKEGNPSDPDFQQKCCLSPEDLEDCLSGKTPLPFPKLLSESKTLGSWAKQREGQTATRQRPPTPTFCGHTPLPEPKWAFGHLILDTGAGKPNTPTTQRKLSLINVRTQEITQTPADCPEPTITPKDYAKKIGKAIARSKEIPPPN